MRHRRSPRHRGAQARHRRSGHRSASRSAAVSRPGASAHQKHRPVGGGGGTIIGLNAYLSGGWRRRRRGGGISAGSRGVSRRHHAASLGIIGIWRRIIGVKRHAAAAYLCAAAISGGENRCGLASKQAAWRQSAAAAAGVSAHQRILAAQPHGHRVWRLLAAASASASAGGVKCGVALGVSSSASRRRHGGVSSAA